MNRKWIVRFCRDRAMTQLVREVSLTAANRKEAMAIAHYKLSREGYTLRNLHSDAVEDKPVSKIPKPLF